ncbi:MAG: hypothetical protein ABR985_18030 [Methanotrichaceae archaeon]
MAYTKGYKSIFGTSTEVLKDISLEIRSDEICGILGPNWLGKDNTDLHLLYSDILGEGKPEDLG